MWRRCKDKNKDKVLKWLKAGQATSVEVTPTTRCLYYQNPLDFVKQVKQTLCSKRAPPPLIINSLCPGVEALPGFICPRAEVPTVPEEGST